jgi:GNAT superfamily N-acetyltransferase
MGEELAGIRRARAADAEALSDLYVRARAAAALSGSIPPSIHSEDDVGGWMGGVVAERETWLAESGAREVMGLLVLDGGWIDQLYVDPGLLGHGIGSRLLEVAKRERPEGLLLWTFVANSGAQRFYARHGFIEVRRTDGSGNEEGAPDIQLAWRARS